MVNLASTGDTGDKAIRQATGSPVTSASGTGGSAIELAANYAAAQPFTAPRPDQWIYIETKNVSKGAIALSKGAITDSTSRVWRRADGIRIAFLVNGKLHVQQNLGRLVGFSKNDYASMAALPSDPQALLALFRKELQDPTAGPMTERQIDSATFTTIAQLLERDLLPPEVTAALLRAAAAIPGVTQSPEAVAVDGREVIAVGHVDDWMREDILIAKDTKELVGYRGVTVKEHTEQIRQVRSRRAGRRRSWGRCTTRRVRSSGCRYAPTPRSSTLRARPDRTGSDHAVTGSATAPRRRLIIWQITVCAVTRSIWKLRSNWDMSGLSKISWLWYLDMKC